MWSSNYSSDPETAKIDLGYRNMVPKEWDVTSGGLVEESGGRQLAAGTGILHTFGVLHLMYLMPFLCFSWCDLFWVFFPPLSYFVYLLEFLHRKQFRK